MARYRKKPVIIEAIQYNGCNKEVIDEFVGEELVEEPLDDEHPFGLNKYVLFIPTLEGLMRAEQNDYIIRGVQGEYYPCKPNIFEQTYELVED